MLKTFLQPLFAFVGATLQSVRDLAPIVVVIALFQLVVIGQPMPDWLSLLTGTAVIVAVRKQAPTTLDRPAAAASRSVEVVMK